MENEKYVRHWMKSALENCASMDRIFAAGEYVWALFLGHLIVEKLLKALCAEKMANEVPRIHNLFQLANLAGLEITEQQKEAFSRLMLYHIRARYVDEQQSFVKVISRERAEGDRLAFEEVHQWLLQILSRRLNP